MDLLEPATAAGLNRILDGQPLVIPENGGEVVRPAPRFRFIATGNSNGAGDRTGLYQGVLRQNLAFLDRFFMVEVGYPAPAVEQDILARKAPGLPEPLRASYVEVANQVRRLFTGEGEGAAIEVTLSTRTLVRWAYLTQVFQGKAARGVSPVHYALDRALGFRAEPETHVAIHEIVQRALGEEETS